MSPFDFTFVIVDFIADTLIRRLTSKNKMVIKFSDSELDISSLAPDEISKLLANALNERNELPELLGQHIRKVTPKQLSESVLRSLKDINFFLS